MILNRVTKRLRQNRQNRQILLNPKILQIRKNRLILRMQRMLQKLKILLIQMILQRETIPLRPHKEKIPPIQMVMEIPLNPLIRRAVR